MQAEILPSSLHTTHTEKMCKTLIISDQMKGMCEFILVFLHFSVGLTIFKEKKLGENEVGSKEWPFGLLGGESRCVLGVEVVKLRGG